MLNTPVDSEFMPLYNFKGMISECLRLQNKPLPEIRRPGKRLYVNIGLRHSIKKRMSGRTDDIPCKPVREDQKGHFDISLSTRGQCKNPCCKGTPVTYCIKCKVFISCVTIND